MLHIVWSKNQLCLRSMSFCCHYIHVLEKYLYVRASIFKYVVKPSMERRYSQLTCDIYRCIIWLASQFLILFYLDLSFPHKFNLCNQNCLIIPESLLGCFPESQTRQETPTVINTFLRIWVSACDIIVINDLSCYYRYPTPNMDNELYVKKVLPY